MVLGQRRYYFEKISIYACPATDDDPFQLKRNYISVYWHRAVLRRIRLLEVAQGITYHQNVSF